MNNNIKRIDVTPDGTIWIDVVNIVRNKKIIGRAAYLCQGSHNDPTEFFISKFDIKNIIEKLQELEKDL